jgi:hypothetical protein
MYCDWSFELSSSYSPCLETLKSLIGSNEDFDLVVYQDDFGHNYQFRSKHLNLIETPNAVYHSALQLIQLLNGVMFFIHEEPQRPLSLGNLYQDAKSRVSYDTGTPNNIFNVQSYIESSSVEYNDDVPDLLQLAKKDQNIRDLLYISGEEITFHKLYMIYETLKSIAGSTTEFESMIGTELKKKTKEFTFVANNFETIGTQARHRNYKMEAPENPMKIEEATQLIKTLSHLVLKRYHKIKLPFVRKKSWRPEDLF